MKDNIPHHRVDQYGFTLIELMISLVLGLLISAAVMQVFLTSQRVDRIQTAASEIQDKAVFGLQAIESQVRLANLGNDGVAINDTTAMGGVVLTAGDYDGNGGEGSGGEGSGENGNDKDDKDDKDDKKKKEELEKEAKEKEKEAEEKEKEAKEKEKEAEEKEKEAKEKEKEAEAKEKEADNMSWWDKLWGKDREKRAEAAKKRAEAEAKRAEAEAKRAEAAKIGNNTAYNFRSIQPPTFQRASFQNSNLQRADFQRPIFQTANFRKIDFQKVALSSTSEPANVMVKGGLGTGYLTRSNGMGSKGSNTKWNGLSNTNQTSDQLTIQYINTTGRTIYDCEGAEILAGERVITRYFVTDGTGTETKARKNLNLRCDAGRITSDGKLEKFMDSGETIIENIDQFNIRLGVQSLLDKSDPSTYQYADMTVAEYMALSGEKPAITNIRIAILARSTANSPEASADKFMIFGEEQSLKDQNDAPKYLRRVYESNILLRNARIMRIIDTTVV